MGDVLMSTPAFRALKESFQCNITLLTSSAAAAVAPHIGVDDVIVCDVPWVKLEKNEGITGYLELISRLRKYQFDAAVIFTVFSQNPMPAIMLAYLAGIPSRLAYCRENPYELLTDWVPEPEPYSLIRHQVIRDLDLVASVGAVTKKKDLNLNVPRNAYAALKEKLNNSGIDFQKKWMIVHPCASEKKREYPLEEFKQIIRQLADEDIQLVFTGVANERDYINKLTGDGDKNIFVLAGQLNLEEFIGLIDIAPLLLSVNSGPVHIAAALKTPVVVLYALTNPQHTPWMTENRVFTFPVDEELKSKNEVLRYVDEHMFEKKTSLPDSIEIVDVITGMLQTSFSQPLQQQRNQEIWSSR